jgi:hypothetical protein
MNEQMSDMLLLLLGGLLIAARNFSTYENVLHFMAATSLGTRC